MLVEIFATLFRTARARNFNVLEGELVVVGKLLALHDAPQGKDDDVLVAQYVHHLRVTVWLFFLWGGRKKDTLDCCCKARTKKRE